MPTKETGLQHLKNGTPITREPYWLFKRPEAEEGEGSLNQIFGVLRRRLAIIASVAVLTTSAAAYWTSTRIPKYEGRFQLLVEPLKRSDSELLRLLSESLKQNVSDIAKETQAQLDYQALMEVLRSPKLINPVIREIQAKYPDVNADRLVGNDTTGKVASGREGTLFITRITQGKDESRVVEVRYRDSDPQKINFILDKVSQAYRKYSVEQQQTNLRQGIRFVDQQVPNLRTRVNTLQSQLQNFQQRYGVVNPDLQSEQILKRAEQLRLERLDTERKLTEAKTLYVSLQSQLGMQQDAAIAAAALSESPQYQELQKQIREIDAQIAKESSLFTEDSPKIQGLREQKARLLPLLDREARVALGSRIAPTVNPGAVTYQNSIRRDLTQQMANTANQIRSLEASLNNNTQAIVQANQLVQQYPQIARQYTNLQRELQIATDTLTQLLSRQEALRVEAAQQEIPWELIMPPTLPRKPNGDPIPVLPDRNRDIVLGGIAGLLLGVLVAFLVDNLHNVFHDPEQVRSKAKIPLLGVIPYQKQIRKIARFAKKEMLIAGDTTNNNKEQKLLAARQLSRESDVALTSFCSLYTRVKALRAETPTRAIAVTSAAKGEGKTTVAVHLAQMAAEAGQRVLLIDANLHQPTIHGYFGLLNSKGLHEVLAQGLDLDDVIAQAPGEENLFIVPGGESSSNSAKLFASHRMHSLIEQAGDNFDLVIFDTPQLLGRLDANILATQVDGILLVVALGKTSRTTIKQVMEETKAARFSVLGSVINNVHP